MWKVIGTRWRSVHGLWGLGLSIFVVLVLTGLGFSWFQTYNGANLRSLTLENFELTSAVRSEVDKNKTLETTITQLEVRFQLQTAEYKRKTTNIQSLLDQREARNITRSTELHLVAEKNKNLESTVVRLDMIITSLESKLQNSKAEVTKLESLLEQKTAELGLLMK